MTAPKDPEALAEQAIRLALASTDTTVAVLGAIAHHLANISSTLDTLTETVESMARRALYAEPEA